MPSTIDHTIDPVYDERSRILVLGSIPSPKSREQGFYYGHPQNRFWRVLAALFDEPVPRTIADKRDLLLRRRIALWDVVATCEIEGASDASIRNAVPNDLNVIFAGADIRAVFCTGAKAGELYTRLCPSAHNTPCTVLPSTSPANAKASLGHLIETYREHLAPHLAMCAEKRILPVADVVNLEQEIARRGTSLAELMERAGRALAYRAASYFRRSNTAIQSIEKRSEDQGEIGRFVVLCGNGNNGGDGWVAARELADEGHDVTVVCAVKPTDLDAQPARDAAIKSQAHLTERKNARIAALPSREELDALMAHADVVIDAILGTGFEGAAVRAPLDMWIAAANEQRARGTFTVAADVPSGLSAQTGRAAQPCMKADATVTMIASKPGLETPYAFAFCGTVHVAEIAYIDPILDEWEQADRRAAAETKVAPPTERAGARSTTGKPAGPNEEFIRPEAEDDDGYDPYSDRKPEPEPLFQQDPWS